MAKDVNKILPDLPVQRIAKTMGHLIPPEQIIFFAWTVIRTVFLLYPAIVVIAIQLIKNLIKNSHSHLKELAETVAPGLIG